MKRFVWLLAIVVPISGCLYGCSFAQHSSIANSITNKSSSTPDSALYQEPQRSLPKDVSTHLSTYAKRLEHTTSLPLIHVLSSSGIDSSVGGTNILYIDPMQFYAITPLHEIWGKLKVHPTVVWVHTTEGVAKQEWKTEGFTGDPLPSSHTNYTTTSIPTPDAYHKANHGWIELPGVLRTNESDKWITFFAS